MKFKHLLVFASLIFSLQAEQTTQFSMARTNFEAIQNAQIAIETMLKWHTFYKIATASCFITACGGGAYAAYRMLAKKETVEPTNNPVDAESFNRFSIRFFELMDKTNKENTIQKNWFLTSIHWLKQTVANQFYSIAVGVGATMVFNVMNNALGPISKYITRLDGVLDRTVSGIFHKNSLEWFITNQVSLVGISTTLKHYAALVDGRQLTLTQTPLEQEQIIVEPMNESKRLEALQEFRAYWTLFIQQLESVLAFMHYKSLKNSNPVVQERMIAITNKIQALVNDFAQNCEDNVKQSERGLILVYDALLSLTGHIGFEFSNFSLLDSAKRIDVMDTQITNKGS